MSRPHAARQSPSPPPINCQDDALHQELANDLPARRTNRRADRKFLRARRAPGRQKVGQIGAGDEQHQRNRAEQQAEAGPVIAHLIFQQRRDGDANVGVRIRILFRKPRRDLFHLGQRLLDRHAFFQAAPAKQSRVIVARLPGSDGPSGA